LNALHNLAGAYREAGNLQQAILLYEQMRPREARVLGPGHPQTATTLNNLGTTYWATGQYGRSVPVFEEALKCHVKAYGARHAETIRTAVNLGINYRDAGRLIDAVRVLDEWLPRAAQALSPDHPVRNFAREIGAQTYARAGRHDRAEPLLREAGERVKLRAGAGSLAHANQLGLLGQNLLAQKKWAEAEGALRASLVIRAEKEPAAWTTPFTRSLLGAALLGQKKFAEAEPLLREGYQGLKEQQASIPAAVRAARLAEAAGRLVRLYDGWGKKDEAARWRKALPGHKGKSE
jgi:tetratricopeptide (TPR) repeat protein